MIVWKKYIKGKTKLTLNEILEEGFVEHDQVKKIVIELKPYVNDKLRSFFQ